MLPTSSVKPRSSCEAKNMDRSQEQVDSVLTSLFMGDPTLPRPARDQREGSPDPSGTLQRLEENKKCMVNENIATTVAAGMP